MQIATKQNCASRYQHLDIGITESGRVGRRETKQDQSKMSRNFMGNSTFHLLLHYPVCVFIIMYAYFTSNSDRTVDGIWVSVTKDI